MNVMWLAGFGGGGGAGGDSGDGDDGCGGDDAGGGSSKSGGIAIFVGGCFEHGFGGESTFASSGT